MTCDGYSRVARVGAENETLGTFHIERIFQVLF